MGMSTYVQCFISEEDETYQKMKKVLLACKEARIRMLPKEAAEYFGSDYVDEHLLEEKLEVYIPCTEYKEDMIDGIEIKVSDIPKSAYKIRFYNSW